MQLIMHLVIGRKWSVIHIRVGLFNFDELFIHILNDSASIHLKLIVSETEIGKKATTVNYNIHNLLLFNQQQ